MPSKKKASKKKPAKRPVKSTSIRDWLRASRQNPSPKEDQIVADINGVFTRWVGEIGERRALEHIEDWCESRLSDLEAMRFAEDEEAQHAS